jgi:hypothetical protein
MTYCNNAYIEYQQLLDNIGFDELTCLPIFNTETRRIDFRIELTNVKNTDTTGIDRQIMEFNGRVSDSKVAIDLSGRQHSGAIQTSDGTYHKGLFTFNSAPRSVFGLERYVGYRISGEFLFA